MHRGCCNNFDKHLYEGRGERRGGEQRRRKSKQNQKVAFIRLSEDRYSSLE
jgi:hypothetical protein